MPRVKRPYRPKTKGCYQCSRRRVDCDRSEPVCKKCLQKGLECSGLGIRHRFNEGFASRGHWIGKPIASMFEARPPKPSSPIQPTPGPDAVLWNTNLHSEGPEPFAHCQNESDQIEPLLNEDFLAFEMEDTLHNATPCAMDTLQLSCAGSNSDQFGQLGRIEITDEFQPLVIEPESHLAPCDPHKSTLTIYHHDRILFELSPDNIPAWRRMLMLHFSEYIARDMVAIDGGHNGWRHLILPIAQNDTLVESAVLYVSASHLLMYHNGMLPNQSRDLLISQLYSQTITGLKELQNLETCDHPKQLSIFLTLLLLLTATMVTGSADFPIIMRSLLSALHAIGGESKLGSSDLAAFISQQTHKMRIYAAPFMSELDGLELLSSETQRAQVFQCLNHCSNGKPEYAPIASCIKSLVQQASDIYLGQATNSPMVENARVIQLNIHRRDTIMHSVQRVQGFVDTLKTFPPGAPGEQVLIWASYLAASAAVLDEHQMFFDTLFQHYYERSGFRNVLRGLEQLRKIWKRQPWSRWTTLLPELQVFVM